MSRLRRLWARFRRWWVDPFPAEPGPGARSHRAIVIELGFRLHADGTVYHIRRDEAGDRRVRNDEVVAMVHTEYRRLVEQAKGKARRRRVLRALGLTR